MAWRSAMIRATKMKAMCRWWAIVVCAGVLPALPGSVHAFTYSDPEGRFWCALGGRWRVADVEPGSETVAHLLREEKGRVVAEVLVTQRPAEEGETFETFVEIEHRRLQGLDGVRIVSHEDNLRLGGQRMARWVLEMAAPTGAQSSKRAVSQYAVRENAVLWGLTVMARPAHRSVIVEIDRMLSDGFHFGPREEAVPALAEGKRYVEAAGRYGLDPPNGWLRTVAGGNRVVFDGERARLAITVEPRGDWASAEEAAAKFVEAKSALTEVAVVGQGAAEDLPGAYAMEYTGTHGGSRWHVRLVALLGEKSLYLVLAICPDADWDGRRETLLAAQRSFALLTDVAAAEGAATGEEAATPAEAEASTTAQVPAEGSGEAVAEGTAPEQKAGRRKPIWSPKSHDNVPH